MKKLLMLMLIATLLIGSIPFAWAEGEEYTISVQSYGHGMASGGGSGPAGTIVSAYAAADPGYHFKEWTWPGASGELQIDTTNPQSFTISRDVTVTAVFAEDAPQIVAAPAQTYTVSVRPNPENGGNVYVNGTQLTAANNYEVEVEPDSPITIKASANNGFTFVDWYVGTSYLSKAEEYEFTSVSSDMNLTASFNPEKTECEYTLRAEPVGAGEPSCDYPSPVPKGRVITFTANPNEGYKFVGWYEGANNLRSTAAVFETSLNDSVLITAKYEKKQEYQITLVANPENGGTQTGPTKVYEGDSVVYKASPNPGFTFAGWYVGNTLKSASPEWKVDNVTTNATIVAVYNKMPESKYRVTFKPGRSDVSGAEASIPINDNTNEVYLGDAPRFSREGFKLIGWSLYQNSSAAEYGLFDVVKFYNDTVLYPVWNPKCKITLRMDPFEGGNPTVVPSEVYRGEATRFSANPADGYTFLGWYYEGSLKSTDAEWVTNVSGDVVIIARYTDQPVSKYSAVFKPGRADVAGSEFSKPINDKSNEVTMPEASAFSREGYLLKGWSLSSNAAQPEYGCGTVVKFYNNAVLYPVWIKECTVTVTPDPVTGGNPTVSPSKVAAGETVTFTANTYKDYTFAGWYIGNVCKSTSPVWSVPVTTDAAVTAKYISGEQCIITLVANPEAGGNPRVTSAAVAGNETGGKFPVSKGETATFYANPNTGYTFVGWYDTNNTLLSSSPSWSTRVTIDATVIAKYSAGTVSPYTLTFKPGRSDVAGQEFSWPLYYGQTVILPGSSVFSKNGYQLIGWSFNQNASYVDYSAGGTATFFGNTVLYPVWSPVTPNKSIYVDYSDHGTVYWGNTKIGRGNSVPVQPGQTITLTFSPQNKYYVYGVNITGKHYSSLDSYTFSYDKMNGNQTVYVRFGSIYGAPKTGDDSNAAFWAVLGICSLCCGAAAGVLAKKKRWE